MRRLIIPLALFLTLPSIALADKQDPSKTNLPVDAKLIAKKTTFKMDIDGAELKKLLEAAKESGKSPPPPVVEMTLELRNRTQKDVQIWIGGDPVQMNFELKGPGVVTHKPMLFFTADFRGPKPMTLEPGKSYSIPIKALVGGFRGASEYVYWTEAGEYTLTAHFKTGVSPAPEGAKADESGFAPVTVKSDTIKIKVEGK